MAPISDDRPAQQRAMRAPCPTPGDPVDDAQLMRSLQDGDLAAFEELYDRHAGAVHGVAYRILRERSAAEDLTQEAFLTMWRRRHRYAPERGMARSWLLAIAHNAAIDALRRGRGHLHQPFERGHDGREAPERTDNQVLQRLEAATITEALQALPPTQRRVVGLAYFGGLTQAEIAAELRLPLGTVKGRIRLGLGKLAQRLEPDTG